MVYKNMAGVLVGVYQKLQKKRDNLQSKKSELGFRLTLLEHSKYAGSPMCEDVEKELNKTECSLADVNAELELIEEKINGGASLDRFILNDEDLKKVEDKLNEENDDLEVGISRVED